MIIHIRGGGGHLTIIADLQARNTPCSDLGVFFIKKYGCKSGLFDNHNGGFKCVFKVKFCAR